MTDEFKSTESSEAKGTSTPRPGWRTQQNEALKHAIESADRGVFASPEEVGRFFKRFESV